MSLYWNQLKELEEKLMGLSLEPRKQKERRSTGQRGVTAVKYLFPVCVYVCDQTASRC